MKSKFLSVLVLLSCTSEVDKVIDTSVVEQETVDSDGDGYDSTEDCDDFMPLQIPEPLNSVMGLITTAMDKSMKGS